MVDSGHPFFGAGRILAVSRCNKVSYQQTTQRTEGYQSRQLPEMRYFMCLKSLSSFDFQAGIDKRNLACRTGSNGANACVWEEVNMIPKQYYVLAG